MSKAILIAHRGNVSGKDSRENSPELIESTIKAGFAVEVDLWRMDDKFFLGHDAPVYIVPYMWLAEINDRLWIHCKNHEALEYAQENMNETWNFFSHDKDPYTLTSQRFLWAHPTAKPIKNAIIAVPEVQYGIHGTVHMLRQNPEILGICTDNPYFYKQMLQS